MEKSRENLSDLERAEAAEAAHDRLLEGFNALPVGFCIWDPDDRLVFCNESYRELFGRNSELIKTGLSMAELAKAIYRSGQAGQSNMTEKEWVAYRIREHHKAAQADEIHDYDNRCVRVSRAKLQSGHVVASRVDVTDLRDTQAELADKARKLEAATQVLSAQAYRDPLTQISNRRAWDAELPRLMDKAAGKQQSVLIFCLDVDGFKPINDSFGHATGDAVLVGIAERLSEFFGSKSLLARAGGDEFIAALPSPEAHESAEAIARQLIKAVSRPITVDKAYCDFGISVGVTICSCGSVDLDSVLLEADTALYQAKRSGRNRYKVFDKQMRSKHARERKLSSQLSSAIADGQIIPFYQPKISISTGRIVGLEALARWQHPEFGLLPPSEFLHLADNLKLTSRLDDAVMRQAVEKVSALQEEVRLSVNITADRLRASDFMADLTRLPLDPKLLSLELVESAFLDNRDDTIDWNLAAVKEMGIGIDLDDFGSGHASIIALLNIRPTRLKIDRHLVNSIETDQQKRTMIGFVVSMAQTLDAQVVAEGVETEAQAQILAELGCDELQGFLFSKPVRSLDAFDFDAVCFTPHDQSRLSRKHA